MTGNEQPQPSTRPDRIPLLNRKDLKPEERIRVGRVAVTLLGWGLVATATLAVLALWHLIRRGRILRANLSPPKIVSLPEPSSEPENLSSP